MYSVQVPLEPRLEDPVELLGLGVRAALRRDEVVLQGGAAVGRLGGVEGREGEEGGEQDGRVHRRGRLERECQRGTRNRSDGRSGCWINTLKAAAAAAATAAAATEEEATAVAGAAAARKATAATAADGAAALAGATRATAAVVVGVAQKAAA